MKNESIKFMAAMPEMRAVNGALKTSVSALF